jgi:hypothetical protein
MYKAEMVADSINPQGRRISTLLVTMPRFILAEFNTHRMLSRNSASSRAIPFGKLVQSVKENPFIPLRWMKEHTGMQGTQYFGEKETFISTNPFDKNAPGEEGIRQTPEGRWVGPSGALDIIPHLREKWLWLRDMAVQEAEMLNNAGVLYHPNGDTSKLTGDGRGLTKQMCNRLLEPFMWHTVLVTATEWENFFALRAHPAAEIHMQHVANLMLETMNASTPVNMPPGGWHIPFNDKINDILIPWVQDMDPKHPNPLALDMISLRLKISTMMCARTSYIVPGGDLSEWTIEKYVEKHDAMVLSGHWSPFEHPAKCMSESDESRHICGKGKQHGWCGNFRGWIQYRKTFENENQSDNRLIKKHG